MPLDVQGTFVSQKINRVRWIPEEYVETIFTGSWDDDVNSVKVWSFESNDDEEVEYPKTLSEFTVQGDVTDMQFTDKNRIAVSSSEGDVVLLEINNYDRAAPLKDVINWKKLHKFGDVPSCCTALATIEHDIATVGEDGSINYLKSSQASDAPFRTITCADSCSLHSVCFVKYNEILTGNLRGHMKIWDLRSQDDKPTASFLLAGDELAATCLVSHPTQPHIVLAGSESGSLAIWDLRMNSFPTSLLSAHSGSVTEMQFHPDNPLKLISCSVTGEIWEWNMEAMIKSTKGPGNEVSMWMPLEDKNTMIVNSLMPTLHKSINSVHCDRGRILCAGDNEAVYLIKNFKY